MTFIVKMKRMDALNIWRYQGSGLKFYIPDLSNPYMASTPPGAQKMKIDYIIDKKVYDEFVKNCSRKGFAPQVITEKLMKKFNETGQA